VTSPDYDVFDDDDDDHDSVHPVYITDIIITLLIPGLEIEFTAESDIGFVSPKYRNIGRRKFHVNRRTLDLTCLCKALLIIGGVIFAPHLIVLSPYERLG